MTEQEIRQVRDRWDKAYDMLLDVRQSMIAARRVEKSLEEECERLAEIIAEHDHAPIVAVDVAEANRVVTEDDGEAT